MNDTSKNRDSPAPWPLALGLLTASFTTMFGCLAGFEQETILLRCVVSGGVVCVMATGGRSIWQAVSEQNEL